MRIKRSRGKGWMRKEMREEVQDGITEQEEAVDP